MTITRRGRNVVYVVFLVGVFAISAATGALIRDAWSTPIKTVQYRCAAPISQRDELHRAGDHWRCGVFAKRAERWAVANFSGIDPNGVPLFGDQDVTGDDGGTGSESPSVSP